MRRQDGFSGKHEGLVEPERGRFLERQLGNSGGRRCEPAAESFADASADVVRIEAPTALVASSSGCTSIHLAYENGRIYWTDQGHGTVKSIATTGGAAASLSTNEVAPTSLLVRDGRVYWIDSGNNSIRAVASGDGAPMTLVATAPASLSDIVPCDNGCIAANVDANKNIHGIALSPDGGTMWFTSGTEVYEVPRDGGAIIDVGYSAGPRHGVPMALAVDDAYAYYMTNLDERVEMMSLTTRCDLSAANAPVPTCPLSLARGQGSALLFDTIIARGHNVYWANNQSVRVGSVSAKLVAGLAGTDGTNYATAFNAGNVTGFAVGTSNAYFGEFPSSQGEPAEGFIERAGNPPYAPPDINPTAVVIARNQPNPTSFALDGTNVYWTTSNCDIEMIADSPQ